MNMHPGTNQNGIALVTVLWVLVLLTVLVGEFAYTMRCEVNTANNLKLETQAYYIALAGFNRAVEELIKKENNMASLFLSTDPDIPPGWNISGLIAEDFENGRFYITINNTSGKTNINHADFQDLMLLFGTFDIPAEQKAVIVDSILDWRDKDHLHRLKGAEDDYYQSLENPYFCRDGDFVTVEELLLVKGVNRELFDSGLKEMVTVYPSQDPEKDKPGHKKKNSKKKDLKININYAEKPMLMALPGITEPIADEIIRYRQEKGFTRTADMIGVMGEEVYLGLAKYITLKSTPVYEIRSFGFMNGSYVNRGVKGVVRITGRKDYHMIQWTDRIPLELEDPDV